MTAWAALTDIPLVVWKVPARKQTVWPSPSRWIAASDVRSGAVTVPAALSLPVGLTTRLHASALTWAAPSLTGPAADAALGRPIARAIEAQIVAAVSFIKRPIGRVPHEAELVHS